MRWSLAHAPAARHIVTVSSDAPFLPPDLVARLSSAIADRTDAIALARSRDELHPVIGLWPVALADDLHAWLAAGTRKVLDWADRHAIMQVDFPQVEIGGRASRSVLQRQHARGACAARALIGGAKP